MEHAASTHFGADRWGRSGKTILTCTGRPGERSQRMKGPCNISHLSEKWVDVTTMPERAFVLTPVEEEGRVGLAWTAGVPRP